VLKEIEMINLCAKAITYSLKSSVIEIFNITVLN